MNLFGLSFLLFILKKSTGKGFYDYEMVKIHLKNIVLNAAVQMLIFKVFDTSGTLAIESIKKVKH